MEMYFEKTGDLDFAFDPMVAKRCAEMAGRAYRECTLEGPHSTQVLIDTIEGMQYVAFRGSQELTDFVTDAKAWQRSISIGGVHRGFYAAYSSIEAELVDLLDPELPQLFTGHSLGGALAILGAFHLDCMCNLEAVYTFGQPRVGNAAFVRGYNETLGECTFRVVHEEDLVPRLPGVLMGYRHAGQEIFINSAGTLVTNPSWPEKLLSDVRGLWREWKQRGPRGLATVIEDHAMDRYLEKLSEAPTSKLKAQNGAEKEVL